MPLNSHNASAIHTERPARPLAYHFVSLGCPKNLVDSEQMMATLSMSGMIYTPESEDADILLVNTCGFIDAAKEESAQAMDAVCDARRPDQRIIVTGCFVQRYQDELAEDFPEVDAFLSLHDQEMIAKVAWDLLGKTSRADTRVRTPFAPRLLTTPAHTAYLRIADGCFHQCSFCAIPSFRGTLRSRPIEEIVAEAEALTAGGASELVLIAQDTTSYGYDLYGRFRLVELLSELEQIEGLRWLRLMYAYPTLVDRRLVKFFKSSKKLVGYVDVPIQHGSAEMLERMRRGSRPELIKGMVQRLRDARPGVWIRTTVIVGFPGEEERHFEDLLALLDEVQFDYVGVFRYSDEDGTPAYDLPNKVPEDIRSERARRLTSWAMERARERNQRYVGRMLDVLVDRVDPNEGVAWGRHEGQAPECDGEVCITSGSVEPGTFVTVRITDGDEVNLHGVRHRPPDGSR